MTNFTINSTNLDNCPFNISGTPSSDELRISFENATTKRQLLVNGEQYLTVNPNTLLIAGSLNLESEDIYNYNSISIYAKIEKKVENGYLPIAIATCQVPIPSKVGLSNYSISVDPLLQSPDGSVSFAITGESNTKAYVVVNEKEFPIHIGDAGNGTLTVPVSRITSSEGELKEFRIYITGQDNIKLATDQVLRDRKSVV